MIKQNILIAAYEKPVAMVEIARALGIPTPYIENVVDNLVKSELMCRSGNKVFIDFMITRPEDLLKNLDREITFAEQNYDFIWDIISEAIYTAMEKIIPDKETFPLRPDGGRWIAVGSRYPQNFVPSIFFWGNTNGCYKEGNQKGGFP